MIQRRKGKAMRQKRSREKESKKRKNERKKAGNKEREDEGPTVCTDWSVVKHI